MDKALPMNTGSEAVETAVKVARKLGIASGSSCRRRHHHRRRGAAASHGPVTGTTVAFPANMLAASYTAFIRPRRR
jgi:acetylornithine/succinyldiaminopimelate/putrescine aminotransferase